MDTEVKIKNNKVFILADEGYNYPNRKLCTLEDNGNGYKVKFHSHSTTHQDIYLSLDYDEADYLLDALLANRNKDK